MEPDALPPLPSFNYHGYLPEGVHDTTLEQLHARLVINPKREILWERLQEFLQWAVATGLDEFYAKYSVHLLFWWEGFPGGLSDFRRFFQYLRPQDAAPLGLREGARKGILRVKL